MRNNSRVFISYSSDDREAADRLFFHLKDSRAAPFLERVDFGHSEHVISALRAQMSAADFLVLLLSPEALQSPWVHHELEYVVSTELRQRSITLIPLKVKPCRVPSYLAGWTVIDATRRFEKAIDRVAAMLQAAPLIKLEHLAPKEFEQFVRDVLKAYGFRNVEPVFSSTDLGFDFSAQSTQRDPFGRLETVEWLIEAKGARRQPDTSSLRAFLGALSLRRERGLFVTAGQLTSPAKEWLEHASKTGGPRVVLIEGTELRRLAMAKPRLVEKYFGWDRERT